MKTLFWFFLSISTFFGKSENNHSKFILPNSFFHPSFTNELPDAIIAAIRLGNSVEIAKYFIDEVDIKIINIEGIYKKAQAELMLKDFFEKQPVKSFTIAHKSPFNGGSMYLIGTLETSKGKYRTYFLLKAQKEKTFIQQFRIETENE